MAKTDQISGSVGLDVSDIKSSIKEVVAAIESGTTKIASSINEMVVRIEKGVGSAANATKKASDGVNILANAANSANSNIGNSFTSVNKRIKELNESFARGEGISTYKKNADELIKALQAVGYQADKSGKKIKAPNTLTGATSTSIRKGSIPEDRLTQLNIPQLQQALLIAQNRVALGSKDLAQQQKYIDLQDRISSLLKEQTRSTREKQAIQERLNERLSKQREIESRRAVPSTSAALGMSEGSIAERTKKIEALKRVQANLSSADSDYERNLRKVNTAIHGLNEANKKALSSGVQLQNETKKMSITMEALTRRMAYYFSIGALTNFVRGLIDVRGEFELQQKALAAIIQNKDAADKLFGQITQLAVRSPFQLRELVSYTKQLAAYRIETDKLYDTTKRLADISAGLGVDMNRIILAYGQVRAATVLRGQELRYSFSLQINKLAA